MTEFRNTTEAQPFKPTPPELGEVIIDLTAPEKLLAPKGVSFGEKAVTTGTATENHTVIAKIDPSTGERTGEVALVKIPTTTSKEELK